LYEDKDIYYRCKLIRIDIATKEENKIVWCISDLTNLLFKDNKFDIILKILSPINYRVFERILNNYGMLIKVC
ncbi:methyltransferase type 11, partial [Clostridioides difficile]|nr:methyltransferase type 11 [Clostridioides difficile]EGT4061758.1 methyltransferase type 11 [Clostridioides difficile]EGT5167733.1 methyltransferase type 11 [Clostridioides difficile]MBY2458464.1 methyltransferase type 11 [Clostridioides difficile]MBY2576051.1 methyltransferase type 11 [Clostridioides difficile]